MTIIRKTAVKIQQGKRSLFLTSFIIRDFVEGKFYSIDRLDVQESQGKQRVLNKPRARSLSKDIASADEKNEAFLPTSIFLATKGKISYDEDSKELFFESAEHAGICPFDLVDGQHRIEGLKMAAESNERLLDFPVSVVIGHKLNDAERMLQFAIVNTKQQAVTHGVTQHIIDRLTQMYGVEPLPYLPSWLENEVKKGSDRDALYIVRALNSDPLSPWHGRINFADEPQKTKEQPITQTTFVKSIKSHILSKNHPLNYFNENMRVKILNNYWKAVRNIFIAPDDSAIAKSVAFKSIGVDFFHSVSGYIINHLNAQGKERTVKDIEECIQSTEEYLTADVTDILSPEYWKSGGPAGNLNRSGVSKMVSAFLAALENARKD